MNQRRDARRNRARIIAAATEVFREDGIAAPLELVARRAAVGRGTLYRHFADRNALVAAVLRMRMEALVEYADTYPGDDLLEHLLVEICGLQLDAPGLVAAVRSAPEGRMSEQFEAVVAQTRALLTVIAARTDAFGDTSLDRALALVLRGLRSPDRAELPPPRVTLHLPTARELDADLDPT